MTTCYTSLTKVRTILPVVFPGCHLYAWAALSECLLWVLLLHSNQAASVQHCCCAAGNQVIFAMDVPTSYQAPPFPPTSAYTTASAEAASHGMEACPRFKGW
jgi:hypothetical protein